MNSVISTCSEVSSRWMPSAVYDPEGRILSRAEWKEEEGAAAPRRQ